MGSVLARAVVAFALSAGVLVSTAVPVEAVIVPCKTAPALIETTTGGSAKGTWMRGETIVFEVRGAVVGNPCQGVTQEFTWQLNLSIPQCGTKMGVDSGSGTASGPKPGALVKRIEFTLPETTCPSGFSQPRVAPRSPVWGPPS